jgi:hypothetical protein
MRRKPLLRSRYSGGPPTAMRSGVYRHQHMVRGMSYGKNGSSVSVSCPHKLMCVQTRSCTNVTLCPRCSGPGRVDLLESDKRFEPVSQSVSPIQQATATTRASESPKPNARNRRPDPRPGPSVTEPGAGRGLVPADCTQYRRSTALGYFIRLLQSYMCKNSVPCLRNRISRVHSPRFGGRDRTSRNPITR